MVFEPDSNRPTPREMQIESALCRALAGEELTLHYQPQVDLASGAIVGAEALLRWTSKELGTVAPSEFIPIAERTGLIGHLGEWVLRRACEQAATWQRADMPVFRVGINLSASQLLQPDLAAHIQAVLIATGADPARIGVELTESTAMSDVPRSSAMLRDIRAAGVEVSLDDFGTGYSSLSCLRSLPIDVVKVDRAFVHDVTAAPEDVSVTRAIINMAHGLQLQVLAEGVETEGQLSLLAANGCDRIQGFWFSQALAPDAFEALIREGRRIPDRYLTRARPSRTLLLVDDEENILSSLRRVLRRDGYHIVTACGAAEGLKRMAETEIDVILSDQRMPGMSGVELLRRAKELYPESVRMVLSGYTELQSIIDAINEGAVYKFLTKPWDDSFLRAQVAEAFRRKDLADENRRLARQLESANADYLAINARLERVVAEQREQADLLTSSAAAIRRWIEALPAPALGVDSDGVVAFVNRRAQSLFRDAGRILGSRLVDILPDAPSSEAATVASYAVEVGGLQHVVLRNPMPEGAPPGGQLVLLIPRVFVEAAR